MYETVRFEAFVYEAFHLPYTVPLGAETAQSAVRECVDIYESKALITPLMVIDHQENKAWRIGQNEGGWYLSDTARERYGQGTDEKIIGKIDAENSTKENQGEEA